MIKYKAKHLFKDKKGELANLSTMFIMIALMMLLAIILWVTTTIIQCMNVRTTVQQSLNNVVSTISEDTHTAMREDRMDEYVVQLTDKYNSYPMRLRYIITQDILRSNGSDDGNVAVSSIVDNVTFTVSEDGTQIIISVDYSLRIAYPPIVSTDATFELPITETATINTVFM